MVEKFNAAAWIDAVDHGRSPVARERGRLTGRGAREGEPGALKGMHMSP